MSHSDFGSDVTLSETLDAIPQGVCVLDPDGRITYANASWQQSFEAAGFDLSGLSSGLSYFDLRRPGEDDTELTAFLEGVRDVLEGRRDEFELEHRCPLELDCPWMIGHIRRIAGTHRFVVTHTRGRRDTEERLRASEANLQNLFDMEPDSLVVHRDGVILNYNRAAGSTFFGGPSDRSGIGRKILSVIDPVDHGKIKNRRDQLHATGTVLPWDRYRLRRMNGTVFEAEVKSSFCLIDGARAVLTVVHDVSTVRALEDSLDRTRRQLFEMLENVNLVAVTLDEQGCVTFANRYVLDLTGWAEEEVLGGDWFSKFIPEDVREEVRGIFLGAFGRGEFPLHYENEIVCRDGRRCLIRWSNTVGRDDQDRVVRVSSLGEDITELVSARRALDESERRVRMMYEQTRVGVCSVTLDGRFVEVNDRFCEIVGYDRRELMEMSFQELTHPDDLDEDLANLQRVLSGDASFFVMDKRYVRRDGDIRWVNLTASLLLEEGKPAGLVGVVQDISEHHAAQEALEEAARVHRAIVATTADGYWRLDDAGRIIDVNDQACRMTGYSQSEFRDMSIPDIEARESSADTQAHLDSVMKQGFDRFETRHRRKDGSTFDVEVSTSTVPGSGLVAFVHEITARKRADAILRMLYNVSEQSTSSEAGLEEFCRTVHAGLSRFMYARNFFVVLRDEEGRLTFPLFVDEEDDVLPEIVEGRTLSDYVIDEGKPLLIDRRGYLEVVAKGHVDPFGAAFESWLGVPLRYGGNVLGAMVVQSYDPVFVYTDSDLELLDVVSHGVATAIARKRTALALAEAEASLRSLIDASPDAAFLIDRDGLVLMANDELARRHRFENAEAIVGTNVFEVLPPEVAEQRRRVVDRAFSDGDAVRWEDARDGLILENIVAPIPDPDGGVSTAAVFSRDVTASREAESRLRESEEKFRHIVQGLGAILWEADAEPLQFTFVSSQAESMLGYSVEKWLESIDFWIDLIHPDDRSGTVDACSVATSRGEDHELLYRMRKADGEYVWIRDIVRVITDEAGNPVKLIGLMVDNSAQKEAEEALRSREETYEAMFRTNNAIKLMIDPANARILDANEAAAEFYGHPVETLLAMKITDINGMSEDEVTAAMRDIVASAGSRREFRHKLADGSWRDVEVHTGPVQVRGRTLIFSIIHDQSERKKMEQEARDHQERLKAQNEALALIAESRPLPEVLASITMSIERLAPGALASVLLVEADGVTMRHGAAPSLPGDYVMQIDGVKAGEGVGSCGTAIARKSAVFVNDISTDPLWKDFRSVAEPFDLRACWSTPIISRTDVALGTFAVYHREVREPTAREFEIIDMAVALARVAIEQAHAEDELRQTRQHLIHVIEGSPLPIVEVAPGGFVSLWNKAAIQSFGWKPAEVLGREVPFVPAEDRSYFHTILRRVEQGESIQGADAAILRKDGVRRAVTIHAAPIRDDRGVISGATLVLEDVTETRAREAMSQQLGTAIENAPDSVVVTDRNGVIIHCNPSFCRTSGFDREDLEGKTPRILKSGRHDDAEYARLWQTITAGRIWRGKLWNRRKDGTLFHEDKTIAPVLDAAGVITGFVSVGRDVTLQERLEERLRDRQRVEAIGQLAGGIAHDFNNLLQVILAYLQFTRVVAEEKAPEVLADIDEARRASSRAADLTRQLLAFSRRQVLELRPVNLNDVVAGILKMIGRLIGENVTLRFQPRTDIPFILADPTQIEQVLLNLCLNGRDAMPEGGELEICTGLDERMHEGHVDAANGFVELSVRDTGVGIPPEVQSRVFEPFFTTKGAIGGSGLGLATVYGIVRQHGGFVDFESEEGVGTCFRVALPVHRVEQESPEGTEENTDVLRGTETILFAEDEEPIRRVVERGLREAGYEVLSAKDGREAVETFVQNADRIAIAILDVVMPHLGGVDVRCAIQRVRPDVPILFCTGYSPDERLQVPDEKTEVILKPFAIQNMLRRVRDVLERASQRSEVGEPEAGPRSDANRVSTD